MNRKKFLCMIVLACILLSGLAFPVSAEEDGSLSVGYVLEDRPDRLYVFLDAEEGGDVEFSLNEQLMNKRESLELFKDSDQYVHYFLVLDRSGSMDDYKEQIKKFAQDLMENTEVKAKVTLLSLGENFKSKPEMEIILDKKRLLQRLSDIAYEEQTTDLYDGIAYALAYAEDQGRSGGELYYMILLTDGEPDTGSEEPTADQIKASIEEKKDLLFTAVKLGDNENAADLSFCDYIADQEPASAAQEIAGRINSIYTVCFELDSPVDKNSDINIKLFFRNGENDGNGEKKPREIAGVPIVKGGAAQQEEEIQEEALQEEEKGRAEQEEESETAGSEKQEPGEETSGSEEQQPEEEAAGSEEEESSEEEPLEKEEESMEQIPGGADDTEQKEPSRLGRIPLYGVLLLAGIAAGCGLALLWKKRREDPAMAEDSGRTGQHQGISLCVEVISGRCLTKKRNFSLDRDVIIGSGRKCDIIWEDADVSEQNARIFTRDGLVYIEDLDSRYGTAINGMRIHTPNRLRDGDVVLIGRVQFRVLL